MDSGEQGMGTRSISRGVRILHYTLAKPRTYVSVDWLSVIADVNGLWARSRGRGRQLVDSSNSLSIFTVWQTGITITLFASRLVKAQRRQRRLFLLG